MKEVRAEVEIAAPAERVWQVMTNFAAYPNWNPLFRRIEGRAKTDSHLVVRLEPTGARGFTGKGRVIRVDAPRELHWQGSHLPVPGLFQCQFACSVEPMPGQRTKLTLSDKFSGLLVSMMAGYLDNSVAPALDAMAQAVKERAERSDQSEAPLARSA